MNVLEDKLRAALRETGEEIVPHNVPPLRLRGEVRRHRLLRSAARRRWSAWSLCRMNLCRSNALA